jgi:hypothetical protein
VFVTFFKKNFAIDTLHIACSEDALLESVLSQLDGQPEMAGASMTILLLTLFCTHHKTTTIL